MDSALLATIGGQIALAVAAGATAGLEENGGAAIKDRYAALKRAITRRNADVKFGAIEKDPTSSEHCKAIADALDAHGTSKLGDIVTTARELLALVKGDEDARRRLGEDIETCEAALLKLVDVDVEASIHGKAPAAAKEAGAAKEGPAKEAGAAKGAPAPSEPAASKPAAAPSEGSAHSVPRPSGRLVPDPEHSTTELERSALPIWKRTDRFFMKAGILVASYVVLALIVWLAVRAPPNEALERCRGGETAKCWQVIGAEDRIDEGHKVSTEPLRILCESHQDPCGCAGLAYVNASHSESYADCSGLAQASDLDPKWPCKCTRYEFWKWGQQRTSHCGVPRCD